MKEFFGLPNHYLSLHFPICKIVIIEFVYIIKETKREVATPDVAIAGNSGLLQEN